MAGGLSSKVRNRLSSEAQNLETFEAQSQVESRDSCK